MIPRGPRRWIGLASILALVAPVSVRALEGAETTSPPPLVELVGALHEHSGYSDGWPGTIPADYYANAKANGVDFLGSSEHSDNADLPVTASEGCLDPGLTASCVRTDGSSWDATLAQARSASEPGIFTGFRGFEWTSDRFGHINVYFSENFANAKADGGYADMEAFWKWFERPSFAGGGADGLAVFNHPGDKKLSSEDPAFNWNDFAYVPSADQRMVGIEVFNGGGEYGSRGAAGGYYARALDRGWHVGAVGAEDIGHDEGDDWGGPAYAKTVVLATDNSEAAIRAAMLARRFYAIRTPEVRLDFSVNGEPMGTRLATQPGDALEIEGSVNRAGAIVEVITSGGAVAAASTGSLDVSIPASAAQRYYFLRARDASSGAVLAYGTPVWVERGLAPATGEWLAGDLHVHTCYSHDAYCGPEDDNTGADEFYTASGTVEERFIEAAVRGLDFLAITDHNRVESSTDPGFGTHGVIGVPGYENSARGHAQMLGATRVYDNGGATAADMNRIAAELRSAGGVLQANHPADGLGAPLDGECSDTSGLHWRYGFDVVPDTVEIWNISHLLQPPAPAGTSNADATRYWECFLNRGHRVGATGGSDSHWLSTSAAQGVGNPTTWVFARERSSRGVLRALREGRTSISFQPPAEGGLRLMLEGDADRDGFYEAVIGDEVPAGSALRVRSEGLHETGVVTVRANGRTILGDAVLEPGGAVRLDAPAEGGWVRASLSLPDAAAERTAGCDPLFGGETTYCRNALAVRALTSAMYLTRVGTTLDYTGPTSVHGDSVVLSARLSDSSGEPLSSRALSFEIAGQRVAAVTDETGEATATATVGEHGRSQVVTVTFAGDRSHAPSSTSAVLRWGRSRAR